MLAMPRQRSTMAQAPCFLRISLALSSFVAGRIVEHDDIAGLRRRLDLGLHVNVVDLACRRPVDQPRRGKAVLDTVVRAPLVRRRQHALFQTLCRTAELRISRRASVTALPDHITASRP